ncbi:MAG: VWA domain-containing protein [Gemmatimonadetes bacterium]|uniref:VWA domain-containing protein n=1 Tax=Candidatus Kutchimonas denitrificans TaxID=3056748 RepID=A0AAE4Z6N7_9BACT|nr:VWA domain-containing protein [Gemmatimonadota bacterium]NIR74588.1 VWA domain-containing protein [Candidatus Kutchimonas denitrificans]NIS02778.1 VWA domain-containing protein [Gemmatimonadota bacterium]NIT68939.1 VWA domain-containing protein [Gemmatimonadota bacterium]NIU52244.1 VWA domain-containing protein [Gemmatimonadota bacterium]
MGFSFLAPVFLLGLAAIAIPIWIHLTHRERRDAVRFPSLMFLREVPFKTVRRQRIRHWLLFALRVAAVLLLVAAFARPLLERSDGSAAAFVQARELVVLLDRSHSMAYADNWDRAVEAARWALGNLGADDRATLVTFAEDAEAASQPSGDPAVLLAALDGVELGTETTRYGPALQLAREIIERSDRPRGEALLISDMQQVGWDPANASRLPGRTRLRLVDVGRGEAFNVAITGMNIARGRRGGREEIVVSAVLANFGGRPVADLSASLEIEGERVASREVDLDAGSTFAVTFEPHPLPGRPVRGIVRAGDDALPLDNSFQFVVAPEPPVRILIVEPRGAGADYALYLERALAISRRPAFEVQTERVTSLTESDLDDRSVVVLNDAPPPGGAVGARLREFVEEGGGLLVVLGRRAPPGGWPEDLIDLVPGDFGGPVDRAAEGGGTLGYLDYDHPALEIFNTPRSGDFSTARFYRYRRFQPAEDGRVLARFDDGAEAMVEGSYGEGRVLVLTSGTENFWNDLTIQPVFLPLIHQLVKHLSGYREATTWHRVGGVVDLSAKAELTAGVSSLDELELVIENPRGRERVLRPARDSWYLNLELPGFYHVRQVGDEDRAVWLAANLDPSESDLSRVDVQELAGALVAPEEADAGVAEARALSAEEQEGRQSLWWYLLAAACAILLIETVLSNRARRLAPGT